MRRTQTTAGLLAGFSLALPLSGHDPITTKVTWTREISRIVNRHCLACHGAASSVPLTSYESTRPWAKAIRDQVMTRKMPPWGAVTGFGPALAGNPTLAQIEIDTVVRWVEGGVPKGEDVWLSHTPPPPPEYRPRLHAPFVLVTAEWRAPRNFLLKGIRPAGPEMQIILQQPDGAVKPLLWVRDYPARGGDFVFADAVPVPSGSLVRVLARTEKAGASLALIPAAAGPRPPERASPK